MAELSVEVKNGEKINVKVNFKGELSPEVLIQLFESFKTIENKSSVGEKKAFEN